MLTICGSRLEKVYSRFLLSESEMPSANPAPGWRDSGVRSTDAGGTLHSVGNTGHCWASAITGSDVDFLAFDPNWLHPQYYYSRGYGRQLRCLQVPLGTRTGPDGRENSSSASPPGARLRRSLRSEAARCFASRHVRKKVLRPRLAPFLRTMPSRRDGRPTPPPAARRNVRHAHLRCRWRRPRNCSTKRNRSQSAQPFLTSLQTAPIGRASRRQRVLRRKPQLSSAERHLAPPGVASTRATLRVAVALLAVQLQTFLGKVRPVAHPLEALQNHGWRAQRHRIDRRPKGRNCPHPKLSRDLPTTAAATPLWTGLLLENRDLRSRAPPPPPAEGATSLLLRRLRGRL